MCSWSTGTKTKIHFFLHCPILVTQKQTLFDKIVALDGNILTENEDIIANIFLSGKPNSENS